MVGCSPTGRCSGSYDHGYDGNEDTNHEGGGVTGFGHPAILATHGNPAEG